MTLYSCSVDESFEVEFISFSHQNASLIKLLEKRGQALRNDKGVEEVRKIDKLIDEYKENFL